MTDIERRLHDMDVNGTRGVIALTTQVANQAADIQALMGRLDKIDAKLDSAARIRLNQYVGVGLALLPIYVLLFLSLFHVSPG